MEKATSSTYSECVFVALGIQHAKGMRRILLSSVAYTAVQHFFHIISQAARFSGKKLLNTKCVLWCSVQLLSGTFLILKKILSELSIIYRSLHADYLIFFSDFKET